MSSITEAIKIGEVNFGEYKTDFLVMPRVKEYLEKKMVSLAALLPEGCGWYNIILFDHLDTAKEDDSDINFGKEFKVI